MVDMSNNTTLPEDWCRFFTTCSRCGTRYHMSEGGCDGCADLDDEELRASLDAAAEDMAELRAEAREERQRAAEDRCWP